MSFTVIDFILLVGGIQSLMGCVTLDISPDSPIPQLFHLSSGNNMTGLIRRK